MKWFKEYRNSGDAQKELLLGYYLLTGVLLTLAGFFVIISWKLLGVI